MLKTCKTCRFRSLDMTVIPCNDCGGTKYSKWERLGAIGQCCTTCEYRDIPNKDVPCCDCERKVKFDSVYDKEYKDLWEPRTEKSEEASASSYIKNATTEYEYLHNATLAMNSAILQDTGDRTDVAGTGALRDMGGDKGRCDLLPASALIEVMQYEDKEAPYDPRMLLIEVYSRLLHYLDTLDKSHLCIAGDKILRAIEFKEHNDTLPNSKWPYPLAIIRLSKHYENGAKKYSDRNWEKGLPISNFLDSGIRHCLKAIDGWNDEDHLAAVAWNIVGALWTLDKKPEMQDLLLDRKD